MINQFKGKIKSLYELLYFELDHLSWIWSNYIHKNLYTDIDLVIEISTSLSRKFFFFLQKRGRIFPKVQRSELNCRLLSSDAIEIAISFFPRSFLPEKEGRGTHASLYLLNHEHYSRGVKILGRKRVVIKSNRKMRW